MRARWLVPSLLLIAAVTAVGTCAWDGETPSPGRDTPRTPSAALIDDARDSPSVPTADMRTHALRVLVVDEHGAPAPGTTVFARARGTEHRTTTDTEGRAQFDGLPEREVEFGVEVDGWREEFWGRADAWTRLPTEVECVLERPRLVTLVGRVIDPAGRPIPGASIGIGTSPTRGVMDRIVTSEPDGSFTFAFHDSEGSVKTFVAAWAPDHTADSWAESTEGCVRGEVIRYDFVLEPEPGATHDRALGDPVTWDDNPLPAMRVQRGRVVDEDGTGIGGAIVSTSPLGQTARTSADGSFAVPLAEFDALRVWAPGFLDAERDGSWEAPPIGDVVLVRRPDARAQFVFADDGSPVVGAKVWLDGTGALTDDAGSAEFLGVGWLDRGARLFVTSGSTDLPQPVETYFDSVSVSDLAPLRLERGLRVAGQLLGSDGAPAARAWIGPARGQDDVECATGITNRQGRFVLAGLPRTPGFALEAGLAESNGAIDAAIARFHFLASDAASDPEFTLRFPATVRTSGRVRWGDVHVVPGELDLVAVPVEPSANPHVRPSVRSAVIGPDGSFAFDGAVGESYRLRLAHNPILAQRLSPEEPVLAGTTGVVREATAAVTIRGRLRDRWGPLPKARVRVLRLPGKRDGTTAETLEQGRFVLDGLLPGATYAVLVEKSKWAPDWEDAPTITVPVVESDAEILIEVP